jgi:ABC-type transporter Mla MlaB component
MSKEETASGLLSKVVKFVRNPATSWSDLDGKDAHRDEAVSKQLLKEMIERKRRNDFVRKREFDMLRKMRKREAIVGQDQAGRPSFFQSSMPSRPDDRANTLKKIDEIEAQMSMQWWKTSPRSSLDSLGAPSQGAPRSAAPPLYNPAPARVASAPLVSMQQPAAFDATEPIGLEQQATNRPPRATDADSMSGMKPVVNGFAPDVFLPTRGPMVATRVAKSGPAEGLSWDGGSYDNGGSVFTSANIAAVDVAEVAHDAELEEASIQFANGDDAGAEAGLLDMLSLNGSRVGHSETWMALFDLYRATDQQDKFENAAIEYLERFDRSAPQWFSMPGMVKQLANSEKKTGGSGPVADWICPSTLGIQTVATLRAALARAAMPWRLDWSNLKTIDIAAVEPLTQVFQGWASEPVQLRFIGESQLQKMLEKLTPSGEPETSQEWWRLRLDVLRVTHRPDEFELTALDFCVTYELSPPAWESARCDFKPLDPEGAAIAGRTIIGEVYGDSMHSGLSGMDGDTQMEGSHSRMGQTQTISIELSGLVQGDAIGVLDQLEAKLMGADVMIISCGKLIRVDFSAAGTLLNWVSARQAENRVVQFSDVNRLVAAFFNVIGITEHARVVTRTD